LPPLGNPGALAIFGGGHEAVDLLVTDISLHGDRPIHEQSFITSVTV